MGYFNGIALIVFGVAFFVIGSLKFRKDSRNIALGLFFWGAGFLIIHTLLAMAASNDKIEIYRASIEDGALRPLSDIASISPKWFEYTANIALGLLAAAALWWFAKNIKNIVAYVRNAFTSFGNWLKQRRLAKKSRTKDGLDYGGTAVRT